MENLYMENLYMENLYTENLYTENSYTENSYTENSYTENLWLDSGGMIITIIGAVIFGAIIIHIIFNKDQKICKSLKIANDILDNILDDAKKKKYENIEEMYKSFNNISLGKIKEYFKGTIILRKIMHSDFNNIYYYTDKKYGKYCKRLKDKKVFYKFYSLINKLLIQRINEKSKITDVSMAFNSIVLILNILTILFTAFSEWNEIFSEIAYLNNFRIGFIIFTISLAIVYTILYSKLISRKYKLQSFYTEVSQELEEILEKLNEEIGILEKLINVENSLEKIGNGIKNKKYTEEEKYIKKSLKIEKSKIEIQKELYKKELKKIDEFYEELELSFQN